MTIPACYCHGDAQGLLRALQNHSMIRSRYILMGQIIRSNLIAAFNLHYWGEVSEYTLSVSFPHSRRWASASMGPSSLLSSLVLLLQYHPDFYPRIVQVSSSSPFMKKSFLFLLTALSLPLPLVFFSLAHTLFSGYQYQQITFDFHGNLLNTNLLIK